MPESIRREGRAMLEAIVADFGKLPGVEVLTLPQDWDCERTAIQRLASAADGTLVIAPEFDGILTSRCQWVEAIGGKLLGPASSAVVFLSDKWNLYQTLTAWGVPMPETFLATKCGRDNTLPRGCGTAPEVRAGSRQTHGEAAGWVLKPRWGAGSVGVQRWTPSNQVAATGPMLIQRHCPGLPASCALLVVQGRSVIRCPSARQFLGGETGFAYEGGEVPLPEALDERVARLLDPLLPRLLHIPGLRGYIGVDLILGEEADGSGDVVIEINPRLTTSYLGLRALSRTNLAEAMLEAAAGTKPPALHWLPGQARFDPLGAVYFDSPRQQAITSVSRSWHS